MQSQSAVILDTSLREIVYELQILYGVVEIMIHICYSHEFTPFHYDLRNETLEMTYVTHMNLLPCHSLLHVVF